jgi:hypothetical protein
MKETMTYSNLKKCFSMYQLGKLEKEELMKSIMVWQSVVRRKLIMLEISKQAILIFVLRTRKLDIPNEMTRKKEKAENEYKEVLA